MPTSRELQRKVLTSIAQNWLGTFHRISVPHVDDHGGVVFEASLREYPSILVIVSIDGMSSGAQWLHVSVSTGTVPPTWEVMELVRCAFIGEHRWAVQLHPPREHWTNIHPGVLHLWHRLDAETLPGGDELAASFVTAENVPGAKEFVARKLGL